MKGHEPFRGRYFGCFNVESDDAAPLFMFDTCAAAQLEVARRQALDPEHDDHLTEYHHVFRVDALGVWWNSYEADPFESSPLAYGEIVSEYNS